MPRDFVQFCTSTSQKNIVVGCGWKSTGEWNNSRHDPSKDHPPESHYTIDVSRDCEPDLVAKFEEADLQVGYGRIGRVTFEGLCGWEPANNAIGKRKVKLPLEAMIAKADRLLTDIGMIEYLSGDRREIEEVAQLLRTRGYTSINYMTANGKRTKRVGDSHYIQLTAQKKSEASCTIQ